jgi:hypothetical protein
LHAWNSPVLFHVLLGNKKLGIFRYVKFESKNDFGFSTRT